MVLTLDMLDKGIWTTGPRLLHGSVMAGVWTFDLLIASLTPKPMSRNATQTVTKYATIVHIWLTVILVSSTSYFYIYRVRHKKQPPKKTYISRKQRNLNYAVYEICKFS